jgi:predicted acetyltransferase
MSDTAGGLPLRYVDADTWGHVIDVDDLAFAEKASAEGREHWHSVMEHDRTFCVYDGEAPVASLGAFGFTMTVPGGSLPVAGVTMVGVVPTHRRRGLLSGMIRHHLHRLHDEGGEPVSVLTASESVIYSRFGYGLGTLGYDLTLRRDPRALRPPAGVDDVRLRLVDPATSVAECEAVYRRAVDARPGMIARTREWAELVATEAYWEPGKPGLLCVLAERDGAVVGYARYSSRGEWSPGQGHTGHVQVFEIYADETAGYAALWRYLLDQDLTTTIEARNRPVDDPLLHLLRDMRSALPRARDILYVRLVDVGRALAARTYLAPVDVVLEVDDGLCPWNAGRWRLAGDIKGASCERTTDPADLALDVRELGAVYLGGQSLRALAGAGLVREVRPGALAEAAPAFSHDPAPWLPFGF